MMQIEHERKPKGNIYYPEDILAAYYIPGHFGFGFNTGLKVTLSTTVDSHKNLIIAL